MTTTEVFRLVAPNGVEGVAVELEGGAVAVTLRLGESQSELHFTAGTDLARAVAEIEDAARTLAEYANREADPAD